MIIVRPTKATNKLCLLLHGEDGNEKFTNIALVFSANIEINETNQ